MRTLRVCRPAGYLVSGTVGQWPPATGQWWTEQMGGVPKNRLRDKRGRLGPRAGIPNRKRPNCHSRPRGTLKSAWVLSLHAWEGEQRPRCAKGNGTQGPWRRSATACRRLSRQLHHLLRPCPFRLRSSLAMLGCAMYNFSSYGFSGQAVTLHLPVVLAVFQQEDADHTDVVHGLEGNRGLRERCLLLRHVCVRHLGFLAQRRPHARN